MQKRPVLLVDVDGVLIIGRDAERTPWATDLQKTFGFDKAALQAHFFAPYWSDIVTGKDALLPRLDQALKVMGSSITATELRDYWFANDAYKNTEMIRWLDCQRQRGSRVMLATNQDHERADYLMQDLGLCDHVDGIYYSAALGVAKPDRVFFDKIATRERQNVSQLILIDDTAANVEAAQQAGWRAIHYTGQSPDQLTKAVVNGD